MRSNKITLLVLLSVLLCAVIVFAMYIMSVKLEELQVQSYNLEQQIENSRANTQALIKQKDVFIKVLSKLGDEIYNVKPALDETEFYTALQESASHNSIEVLSTNQQGVNKDGVSTMSLSLRGEYYNMLQLLAMWRVLPMTVRIVNITLRRPEQGMSDLNRIVADATVETILN